LKTIDEAKQRRDRERSASSAVPLQEKPGSGQLQEATSPAATLEPAVDTKSTPGRKSPRPSLSTPTTPQSDTSSTRDKSPGRPKEGTQLSPRDKSYVDESTYFNCQAFSCTCFCECAGL